MQSYWEVRTAEQSLFSQAAIFLSRGPPCDVTVTLGTSPLFFGNTLAGRSQARTSGRWWGMRKDWRNGVKLTQVSGIDDETSLVNRTSRSWLYLPTKLFWMNFQANIRRSSRGSSSSGSVSVLSLWWLLPHWDFDALEEDHVLY